MFPLALTILVLFSTSLLLGVGFIYLYTQKVPLSYYLPNIEKKEVDVKNLERLITSFFPKEEAKKPKTETGKKKKKTTVAVAPSYFKVIGYILGKPSAVLLKFKGRTLVLTEGETKKGIKLLKVTPDYVLIEYNGRQLKVNIKKEETKKVEVKYTEKTSEGVKVIPKSLVDKLTQNYGQLLTQIDIVPYIRSGKTEGFRIRWLATDSIIAKLGFKQGDVILSVNGIPLRNTEDVFRIIQIIRNEPSLRVKILRNGERKTLEIRIE